VLAPPIQIGRWHRDNPPQDWMVGAHKFHGDNTLELRPATRIRTIWRFALSHDDVGTMRYRHPQLEGVVFQIGQGEHLQTGYMEMSLSGVSIKKFPVCSEWQHGVGPNEGGDGYISIVYDTHVAGFPTEPGAQKAALIDIMERFAARLEGLGEQGLRQRLITPLPEALAPMAAGFRPTGGGGRFTYANLRLGRGARGNYGGVYSGRAGMGRALGGWACMGTCCSSSLMACEGSFPDANSFSPCTAFHCAWVDCECKWPSPGNVCSCLGDHAHHPRCVGTGEPPARSSKSHTRAAP
jgi:hypothetical protein